MTTIGGSGDFYAGSRLFQPLSDSIGLPLDQINFLICQLVALGLGYPFRVFLDPRTTSPRVRHAVELLVGASLILFCFGSQIVYLVLHALLGYILTRMTSRSIMPHVVFVVAMGYLAVAHIYRMKLDYGGYTLDVTSPLMISVQKITSVAVSIHDGRKEEKDLTPGQKKQRIKTMPDVLTYFSYIFCFHGVMCGPLTFFNDYVAFMDGSCYKRPAGKESEGQSDDIPSPLETVLKKSLLTVVVGALMMMETKVAPWSRLKEDDFLYNTTLPYRMIYLLCSMSMHRPMYYFAFKLGELVNNASGLGFSGYDENGKAEWDLLNNVQIYKLEVATSLKVNIESWNTITTLWLRHTVYERCPPSVATWSVFLASAVWHGFYPGYYLAFATAALFTSAARVVRRNIRPYFLKSDQHKFFYDCVTFTFTRFANCIIVVPFVLLDIYTSVRLFTSLFWLMHIGSVGMVVYFTFIHKPPKKTEKTN